MTQVLFYGCLFIAFSPVIAFYMFVISRNSQLILLSIGGSFFWLISVLIASVWWYVIPPMRYSFWFIIPFSIIFQEIFRYVFFRLYSWGFNNRPSLGQIQAQHQHQLKLQFLKEQEDKEKESKSINSDEIDKDIIEKEDNLSSSSSSSPNVNKSEQEQKDEGDNDKDKAEKEKQHQAEINARIETLSARPNHTLSSAAIGTGSGITYGFVMFGSIVWDSTGPGTLFSAACPSTNLFMVSAIITMCITILHIALSVLAFQGYRSKQYQVVAFVFLVHFSVSYFTLLNQPHKSCAGSLIPIVVITISSIVYSFHTLLKSDSITKID